MGQAQAALQRYFGYGAFREGQEALVEGLLSERDVLGVLPTGSGKSLCYQLPAILLQGLTLVISPLISLMQDQVAALRENGIAAACMNSAMDWQELGFLYDNLESGAIRLLYVAPERLETDGFLERMQTLDIALLAVDEAHCLSQWGQDFRPSYLKICDFLEALPKRPVVGAFTATATEAVRKDICRLLHLRNPLEVVTGFDRPNLYLAVEHPERKNEALLRHVQERAGRSGIVYCATRAAVEEVCQMLQEQQIPATRYHAGLEQAERMQNQEDFQYDRKKVMVATNAFGMGIDKSNVSYVIHYNMPRSLEAYYQEIGRAGRDGQPADCILLYSGKDIMTARYFIENGNDNALLTEEQRHQVQREDRRRLRRMIHYTQTTTCLRGEILQYFGQYHAGGCGNCSNCQTKYETEDITIPAQMILSCVYRMQKHLGYATGVHLLSKVLTGSNESRIFELGLHTLSTYGLLRSRSQAVVRTYIEFLESQGYLKTDPTSKFGCIVPTPKALEVLRGGAKVLLPVKKEQKQRSAAGSAESPLLSALKEERTRLARLKGVPAYVIFSNATLTDMAEKAPRSMAAFLQVSGVGRVKAEQYGETFLQVIAKFFTESKD